MTLLSVLIALFVERLLPRYRPRRSHRWFETYCTRLSQSSLAQFLMARSWGAALALLPVLLLIALLQWLAGGLGGLFEVAFAVLVLLLSLGPRDLGSDVEAFLEAREQAEESRAMTAAASLGLASAPADEPERSLAVAGAVVIALVRRLTGPLFWFLVFGAIGAAAYRLIQLQAERLSIAGCPEELQDNSDDLRFIADWVPARLTAAGFAVTGNFDAVTRAWQDFDYEPQGARLDEADQLLMATGLAALDTYPGSAQERQELEIAFAADRQPPPVVEDALALVWRTLIVWLAAIAVLWLVAAVA